MRIEGTRAPTIEGAGRKKKTQSTSPSFSMERSAGAAATTRTAPTESPLFIEPQDAVDPDEQRKQQQHVEMQC
ncbi:MAG: hypothetical protein K0U36_06360 [Alphaproteobacteria bacterium]|nr:hypothetical protein [Alphaproteobacteria bacterium]